MRVGFVYPGIKRTKQGFLFYADHKAAEFPGESLQGAGNVLGISPFGGAVLPTTDTFNTLRRIVFVCPALPKQRPGNSKGEYPQWHL
ncbi:MAG: hypothetical protein DDT38_01530 [Firmicutes bacterium]|nr:hypothetical protein [candidate division NPL-UPA2 bacterium]